MYKHFIIAKLKQYGKITGRAGAKRTKIVLGEIALTRFEPGTEGYRRAKESLIAEKKRRREEERLAQKMKTALSALPAEDRQILEMYYINRSPHRAAILTCLHNTDYNGLQSLKSLALTRLVREYRKAKDDKIIS